MPPKIKFIDDAHAHRYHMAIGKIRTKFHAKAMSPEFLATIYLLAGSSDLPGKTVRHFEGASFWNWPEVLKEDLSGGERVMVQLAVALWNGDGDLRISDLWLRLDTSNFELALRAIQYRKYGPEALVA